MKAEFSLKCLEVGRQLTLWPSRRDFKRSSLAATDNGASAHRQMGQREAAELGTGSGPHVRCGHAVQCREHVGFSPSPLNCQMAHLGADSGCYNSKEV